MNCRQQQNWFHMLFNHPTSFFPPISILILDRYFTSVCFMIRLFDKMFEEQIATEYTDFITWTPIFFFFWFLRKKIIIKTLIFFFSWIFLFLVFFDFPLEVFGMNELLFLYDCFLVCLQNISPLFQKIAIDIWSVFTYEKVSTLLDLLFALSLVISFRLSVGDGDRLSGRRGSDSHGKRGEGKRDGGGRRKKKL